MRLYAFIGTDKKRLCIFVGHNRVCLANHLKNAKLIKLDDVKIEKMSAGRYHSLLLSSDRHI
jgi:hypothetical protein